MSSSNFASFAPYAPPPDEPRTNPVSTSVRPWFPAPAPSSHHVDASYQSGGIPTFNTSVAGLADTGDADAQQNQWETRYGMRVDVLAAIAYLLGPISALGVLIIETHNDYVRFHAYQSALLTGPLVFIRIFVSLLQFPSWIQTFFTILILISQLYMAFRAYRDASYDGLIRYQLPVIGLLADQWLREE